MIEAFAPHTPQQPLADRVGARGLDRRTEYLNAGPGCDGLKVGTVLRIVIADQIPRRHPEGRGLPQLLGDPLVCGRAGHAEMDDAPREPSSVRKKTKSGRKKTSWAGRKSQAQMSLA